MIFPYLSKNAHVTRQEQIRNNKNYYKIVIFFSKYKHQSWLVDCCEFRIMSSESDFMKQKTHLGELVEKDYFLS